MSYHKKKTSRRRSSKKKKVSLVSVRRVLSFVLLSLVLVISLCAVGYVIFFRTVFAQEIPAVQETEIVFEEPDPPVHEETTTELTDQGRPDEKELPKVAIIIDDLGYHKTLGEKFINFPYELTYSFLPFAPYTAKQERAAFDSGKTVLLHLPLEPKGKQWDPGPGTLFLSDSPELQKEKFEQALAQVPHAVGVNNHMGSLFTTDSVAMSNLLNLVNEQGMFFVDSITTAESKGYKVAMKLEIPVARRNVFLDNTLVESEICLQLEKLIVIAELKGRAIGIGHPHLETYLALKKCVPFHTDKVRFVGLAGINVNCATIDCKD